MLKFLRKYNKWILVIGGSLLMVAFLAPQAIQQLPKLRDRTVATYDGKPVKASEIQLAANEVQAINALGGTGNLFQLVMPLSAPTNEQDVEWFLLSREAERAGFVGSDQDAITLYPILAQQLATAEVDYMVQQTGQQLPPIQRVQLINSRIPQWQERILNSENTAAGAGRFRTIEEARKAFAKLHGVLRMLQAFERVPRYSSTRATRAASEAFNAATTDYLVIPADRFIDTVAEPTEEEIQAHFEEYKDKNAFETDYGIGYLQPQQVRVEWLAIDRAGIENAITIDPVEASKHQQLNKDRFPGTFSQERPNIEAELKRQQAQRIIGQIENIIQAEMLSATRTLNREGDYLKLPDDWAQTHPSLESLAQTVVDKVAQNNDGLTIPLPTIERRNDRWYGQQDVFTFPGIGFSFLQFGSQQIPFYTAVFSIRELNPNPSFPVQENLLASQFPFKGADGSTFFFRVLDSRDVSAPDSIDEVREQVVTDIKRLRAYEQLLAELPNYTEVAVNAGLEAVADAVNAGLPEPGEEADENTPARVNISEGAVLRSRAGQSTPAIFRDEDVLETAFGTARQLDPTVKIEDLPLAARTYSTEAPKSLSVVVGRISGLQPLTAESFATSYDQVKSTLTQLEIVDLELREYPYSYENLKKRHNFRDTSGQLTNSDDEPSAPTASEGSESSEDN